MTPVGKLLLASGIALVVLAALWELGGRHLPWGRLPGDIAVERGNFRFHFPVATCILASVALSVGAWLFRRFFR